MVVARDNRGDNSTMECLINSSKAIQWRNDFRESRHKEDESLQKIKIFSLHFKSNSPVTQYS